MDPLSQAVVGGALPGAFSAKKSLRLAIFCGIVGGLVPDLDIVIRSDVDPLLSLEYHRHFTHSIFMVPVVGAVVALFLWLLFSRQKGSWKQFYLFSTLGVLTHGLLDTCTAYGTYLLWPFSDARLSFMNMAIIDPLFTLPMLFALAIAAVWKKRSAAVVSIVWGLFYIGVSQYNQTIVKERVYEAAENRGHKVERMFLNPTIGNNIVWRTVYESNGRYYVDGVRAIPFKTTQFYEGVNVPKIDIKTIYPELGHDTQHRKDIQRFNKFSMGYLYEYEPYKLADLRYGLLLNGTDPLWGINLNPENPYEHVQRFHSGRDREKALQDLKKVVLYGDLKTNEEPKG